MAEPWASDGITPLVVLNQYSNPIDLAGLFIQPLTVDFLRN
jgi:hypothetical protein